MLPNHHHSISFPPSSSSKLNFFSSQIITHHDSFNTPKRKRKPAGTPDPNAQVIYLTPEKLMESDRYVCETCNMTFHREQNLQMHRRRHKVPWLPQKAVEAETTATTKNKRVYVCPEPGCVHHDPAHALGDLVGIKKHFRRKHCNHKEWVCDKCHKGYAVLSDYKAHLKTCGTKGHSCDCGRVFSRVETFIEHQDSCKGSKSTTRESDEAPIIKPPPIINLNLNVDDDDQEPTHYYYSQSSIMINNSSSSYSHHQLEELELFPSTKTSPRTYQNPNIVDDEDDEETRLEVLRMKFEAKEMMRVAMENKAMAEEKRREAKYLIQLADQELAKARRIREQVWLAGLTSTHLLRDCSSSSSSTPSSQMIRCNSCKKEIIFQ